MAKLSPARAGVPLLEGLELVNRGKVADTYKLTDTLLLAVRSDGASIFDFTLDTRVSFKGIVLNILSHFWTKFLESFEIKTDLVAAGVQIDEYLPPHLRNDPDLQSRATVIKKLSVIPVEFVFRNVLTGSGFKLYDDGKGDICGHKLPPGLQDGDELPWLLDTPTNKAQVGHDLPLLADEVRAKYPNQTFVGMQAFQAARSHAKMRGIKLGDTKFEIAEDGTIVDEKLSPDSSRYYDDAAWLASRKPFTNRKPPAPFDKQFLRQWGIGRGINDLDPANPAHVAQVHAMEVPRDILEVTTQIYRYIVWRLTRVTVESYLRNALGVKVDQPVKKIAILCGSESDKPLVMPVVETRNFGGPFTNVKVGVMSCHRNAEELRQFALTGCGGADVVIGAGSEALALPGVLDAWLAAYGKKIPVMGVALGEKDSRAFEAAVLSIEQIPGQPVITDELTGSCYHGQDGLWRALDRVIRGELPPPKSRVSKPSEMSAFQNLDW